jgi:geranylgeranyl pyrophosphate synthase
MAGFLAGLPEVERARLKAFGQAMGHCFQLRDDYLDLFGLEEKTGKKRGGDIGNRKLTLPVLFALNHPNGNPFKVWWNQKTADSEERIQACLSWMEDNQIPEKTLKVLNSEMTKGMELLEQIEGNPDAKIKLAELCKLLAYREK